MAAAAAGSGDVRVSDTEPWVVEWRCPIAELLAGTKMDKLNSRSFEMRVRTPELSLIPLQAQCRAWCDGGRVSFFLWLEKGVTAEWCQWIGPKHKKLRQSSDYWDKTDRFWGKSSFAAAEPRSEGGICVLGFALFLATKDRQPPVPAQFKFGKELGSGSFGSVREVEDATGEHDELVAKIAEHSNSGLQTEAYTMKKLVGTPGFPSCPGLFYDTTKRREVMIMQKLHRDLESLRKDSDVGPADRLSPECVVSVGLAVISKLEAMHNNGLIHRDMKPDNIMIGTGRGDDIYLIDFGLTQHIEVQGQHIPEPEPSKNLTGTARYCSVWAHQGLQSRRADMESFFLVLCFLATGRLPWQGLDAKTKEERYAMILAKKQDLDKFGDHMRRQLRGYEGFAEALLSLVKYSRNLKFEEKPDYRRMESELAAAMPVRLARIVSDEMADDAEPAMELRFDWVDRGGLTPSARRKPERCMFFPQGGGASASRGGNTTAMATRGKQSALDGGDGGGHAEAEA